MEGMRRLDEIYRMRRRLPAPAVVQLRRAARREDALEIRVLGYLGPGARTVGDIVDGVLVGGDADEYDALKRARPARGRRDGARRAPGVRPAGQTRRRPATST